MKTSRIFPKHKAFTLVELMVAMAITVIIVTVLVSVTSIALDTWNRSRSELRAARQAKAMVDTMARDFEAMVIRSGNPYEWLSIDAAKTASPGPANLPSNNASELIFFSAATDRYKGNIGGTGDLGGDVSCVGYQLFWKDPIDQGGIPFETFVFNRLLVDPKPTFDGLLGKTDLSVAFSSLGGNIQQTENFVCENVFQFTILFHVEVIKTTGTPPNVTQTIVNAIVPVGTEGETAETFKVRGNGIITDFTSTNFTEEELKAGRLKAVEISLTVLSDTGVDQLRTRTNLSGNKLSEFMAKNSYQYSKLVQVPGM